MNLINSIVGILILAILVVIGYKSGQMLIELSSPITPINVSESKFNLPEEEPQTLNLRWNHFPLTVYVDTDSVRQDTEYVDAFRGALELWQASTNNTVSFFVTSSPAADVTVEWVSSLKEKAMDTLGNTDIKFINISGTGLIQSADIQLLTKSGPKQLSTIDMTNLAIHEMGHALGLNHSDDENDIMYPILVVPSKEIKGIPDKEVSRLQEIYSVEPEPDLRIIEANVSKATVKRITTFYLINISLIIENNGLVDAISPQMAISTDGIAVKNDTLPDIQIGNSLSVTLGNLRVEKDFSAIEIMLDPNNVIDELNETNNFINVEV